MTALPDITRTPPGIHGILCPRCGPDRRSAYNRRRPVLRLWHDEPGLLSWCCARCGWSGYETDGRRHVASRPQIEQQRAAHQRQAEADDAIRRDRALGIWGEAVLPLGTAVAPYLSRRALHLPDEVLAADALRFHRACPFGRARLPAMIGLMRDICTNEPRAIHRTAIQPDGSGKAEPPDGGPAKRMLGPARGAVVKLVGDEDVTLGLGLAEGIENALTAVCAGWRPVWAAGSAGAIRTFPVLAGIEGLNIFADHDPTGLEAARACGRRWAEAEREAALIHPRGDGLDWNDVVGGRPG